MSRTTPRLDVPFEVFLNLSPPSPSFSVFPMPRKSKKTVKVVTHTTSKPRPRRSRVRDVTRRTKTVVPRNQIEFTSLASPNTSVFDNSRASALSFVNPFLAAANGVQPSHPFSNVPRPLVPLWSHTFATVPASNATGDFYIEINPEPNTLIRTYTVAAGVPTGNSVIGDAMLTSLANNFDEFAVCYLAVRIRLISSVSSQSGVIYATIDSNRELSSTQSEVMASPLGASMSMADPGAIFEYVWQGFPNTVTTTTGQRTDYTFATNNATLNENSSIIAIWGNGLPSGTANNITVEVMTGYLCIPALEIGGLCTPTSGYCQPSSFFGAVDRLYSQYPRFSKARTNRRDDGVDSASKSDWSIMRLAKRLINIPRRMFGSSPANSLKRIVRNALKAGALPQLLDCINEFEDEHKDEPASSFPLPSLDKTESDRLGAVVTAPPSRKRGSWF